MATPHQFKQKRDRHHFGNDHAASGRAILGGVLLKTGHHPRSVGQSERPIGQAEVRVDWLGVWCVFAKRLQPFDSASRGWKVSCRGFNAGFRRREVKRL